MLDGEEKIINDAISGEASAFGLLYDKYQPQIYRFIYLKVSHREEAEDLCHQVFLSAWQNINNYRHKGNRFSAWLYSIARNKVIDYYRTKKTIIDIETVQIIEEKENPNEKTEIKINIENVKRTLKNLSDAEQNIIIMRFIEGLSPKETALILNKSEISVRFIQHKAIKKLKKLME